MADERCTTILLARSGLKRTDAKKEYWWHNNNLNQSQKAAHVNCRDAASELQVCLLARTATGMFPKAGTTSSAQRPNAR